MAVKPLVKSKFEVRGPDVVQSLQGSQELAGAECIPSLNLDLEG